MSDYPSPLRASHKEFSVVHDFPNPLLESQDELILEEIAESKSSHSDEEPYELSQSVENAHPNVRAPEAAVCIESVEQPMTLGIRPVEPVAKPEIRRETEEKVPEVEIEPMKEVIEKPPTLAPRVPVAPT